jgi:hypothetical protein
MIIKMQTNKNLSDDIRDYGDCNCGFSYQGKEYFYYKYCNRNYLVCENKVKNISSKLYVQLITYAKNNK